MKKENLFDIEIKETVGEVSNIPNVKMKDPNCFNVKTKEVEIANA